MKLNTSTIFKKGEMFIDFAGWAGIVIEATRGKNPTIIPCTEMFGFEHECGSKYANEVVYRVSEEELRNRISNSELCYDKNIKFYFKGTLINPEVNS